MRFSRESNTMDRYHKAEVLYGEILGTGSS